MKNVFELHLKFEWVIDLFGLKSGDTVYVRNVRIGNFITKHLTKVAKPFVHNIEYNYSFNHLLYKICVFANINYEENMDLNIFLNKEVYESFNTYLLQKISYQEYEQLITSDCRIVVYTYRMKIILDNGQIADDMSCFIELLQ